MANEENKKYQIFIKQYLTDKEIPLSPWSAVQPLYLRFRGRCLKMKPQNYQQFLNLCTFESERHTKYDDKGVLKEGEETKRKDYGKASTRKYAGVYYAAKEARDNYKLNYKEPPKPEDFGSAMDYRRAKVDWNYLKQQLAEYSAVKALEKAQWKKPIVPKEGKDLRNYRFMFEYPFVVRYALRCLSGEYPIECYPDALIDIKDELQEMLDKQKETYNKEPVKFVWNTNWSI